MALPQTMSPQERRAHGGVGRRINQLDLGTGRQLGCQHHARPDKARNLGRLELAHDKDQLVRISNFGGGGGGVQFSGVVYRVGRGHVGVQG